MDARKPQLDSLVLTKLLRLADTARVQLDSALDGIGLSWARYEILAQLYRSGPMTYEELRKQLVRHRTSVAATVVALERCGFVSRRGNPVKPQQILVEMTAVGEEILRRADRSLRGSAQTRRCESNIEVSEALRVIEDVVLAGRRVLH